MSTTLLAPGDTAAAAICTLAPAGPAHPGAAPGSLLVPAAAGRRS